MVNQQNVFKKISEIAAETPPPFIISKSIDSNKANEYFVYSILTSKYVHAKHYSDRYPSITTYDHIAIPFHYDGLFKILPEEGDALWGGLDNERDLISLRDRLRILQTNISFLVNKEMSCYVLRKNNNGYDVREWMIIQTGIIIRISKLIIPIKYYSDSENYEEEDGLFLLSCCGLMVPNDSYRQDMAFECISQEMGSFFLSLLIPQEIDLIPIGDLGSIDTHVLHYISNICSYFQLPLKVQLFVPESYAKQFKIFSGIIELRSICKDQMACAVNIHTKAVSLIPFCNSQKYRLVDLQPQSADIETYSSIGRREIHRILHDIRKIEVHTYYPNRGSRTSSQSLSTISARSGIRLHTRDDGKVSLTPPERSEKRRSTMSRQSHASSDKNTNHVHHSLPTRRKSEPICSEVEKFDDLESPIDKIVRKGVVGRSLHL